MLIKKFNTLKNIISKVNQDIHTLNDTHIEELINNSPLILDRKNLSSYLTFLKKNYQSICNFKKNYGHGAQGKDFKEDGVYTLSEWGGYSNFLTNIDLHIEKAFDNYVYAKYWLYSLLHFSIDWRSADIVSIPALSMLEVDVYTIQWFMNNEFTIAEGQLIINCIKDFLDNTRTRKNIRRKHFIIYLHYVIPTAIAFIIVEQHRRRINGETLFNVDKVESYKFSKKNGR